MKCRHCDADLSVTVLDLGASPPSNAYLSAGQGPEMWYPLRLLVCTKCWLVQTEDFAGREQLFSADYAYFSSYSDSWLAHSRAYVDTVRSRFGLSAGDCVVEVAANDGYLLQYVRDAGIRCYGIEPTASTAEVARRRGIEIVERFFGLELARELATAGRRADLMVANNVLAHVPDINDFVAGFAALLDERGVATFEFPHLLRMVTECQFDTAYHEHYSYLSLSAVSRIFNANGLSIFDVEEIPTHGGSLRVYAQRSDSGHQTVSATVAALLAREQRAGVNNSEFYLGFQRAAEQVKFGLLEYLLAARREGRRVGGYGAAAKGNTLLNFAGVRPDLLSYVVDRSHAKQGKFLPGSRIPIVDEQHLRRDRPDTIVILPWNLRDEIVAQLAYGREWAARFVTFVPTIRET